MLNTILRTDEYINIKWEHYLLSILNCSHRNTVDINSIADVPNSLQWVIVFTFSLYAGTYICFFSSNTQITGIPYVVLTKRSRLNTTPSNHCTGVKNRLCILWVNITFDSPLNFIHMVKHLRSCTLLTKNS